MKYCLHYSEALASVQQVITLNDITYIRPLTYVALVTRHSFMDAEDQVVVTLQPQQSILSRFSNFGSLTVHLMIYN